ncbi:MAG: hypothetical protein KGL39_00055 [Patescibacteria group bacterium]|nr:hypothetical protein [Patescibacteria group bacterium]
MIPMLLKEVQLIAAVGTEVGIVESPDRSVLILTSRRPGEEWPHGMIPAPERTLTIEEGHSRYSVDSGESEE